MEFDSIVVLNRGVDNIAVMRFTRILSPTLNSGFGSLAGTLASLVAVAPCPQSVRTAKCHRVVWPFGGRDQLTTRVRSAPITELRYFAARKTLVEYSQPARLSRLPRMLGSNLRPYLFPRRHCSSAILALPARIDSTPKCPNIRQGKGKKHVFVDSDRSSDGGGPQRRDSAQCDCISSAVGQDDAAQSADRRPHSGEDACS